MSGGIPGPAGHRRRGRIASFPCTIEILEPRELLADGITAAAGAPITGSVGVPVSNAVFASFTVTDPLTPSGENWRAIINFGDGQVDGPVIPIQKGDEFEFIDTHIYRAPGNYTVRVMIALPGSMKPNDNTVTTQVTVSASTGAPTPTPTSPPPPHPLKATGLKVKVRVDKAFHGSLANLIAPRANARAFSALIAWGDLSAPTPGQIRARGKGRFAVIGSHTYATPGIYHLAIAIRDTASREAIAQASVRVIGG